MDDAPWRARRGRLVRQGSLSAGLESGDLARAAAAGARECQCQPQCPELKVAVKPRQVGPGVAHLLAALSGDRGTFGAVLRKQQARGGQTRGHWQDPAQRTSIETQLEGS